MTIFPVDIPVQNVHLFGMYFFGRKQNTGYVMIHEDVSPLPADNAFAGRGLLLGGSSCTLREKGFNP